MNYKAPDNSLHIIEPDFAHLLPAGCVQITEAEAEAIRIANTPPSPPSPPKFIGIEFEGVMCSAMKTDQDGLVAVLVASQLQGANFQPTIFKFENGSVLTITKSNIAAFIATWMPFRQSFYIPA
jgi:hypothetical protein